MLSSSQLGLNWVGLNWAVLSSGWLAECVQGLSFAELKEIKSLTDSHQIAARAATMR